MDIRFPVCLGTQRAKNKNKKDKINIFVCFKIVTFLLGPEYALCIPDSLYMVTELVGRSKENADTETLCRYRCSTKNTIPFSKIETPEEGFQYAALCRFCIIYGPPSLNVRPQQIHCII